jgi:hypothetical protein
VLAHVPDGRTARLQGDGEESSQAYCSRRTRLAANFWPFDHEVDAQDLAIVDDYYWWDGSAMAVHDFLSRASSTKRIQ